MALDAQSPPRNTRSLPTPKGPDAPGGRSLRRGQPTRAAVRRRFDEAALAAAVRELRTHRHSRARMS